MKNLLLGINTATKNIQLSIIDLDSAQIIENKVFARDNNESENLLPSIVKLFDANKLELSSLKKIFVVNGPGSFVSIRLGVLIANTLASNLDGVQLYSMNTFEYLTANGADFAVIFAGGNQVYVYEKETTSHEIKELNQELIDSIQDKKVVFDLRDESLMKGINNISIKSLDSVIIDLISDESLEKYLVSDFPLEVNYVKEPSIQV